jgi:hypothetical protein
MNDFNCNNNQHSVAQIETSIIEIEIAIAPFSYFGFN